jgi:hypothetical protein
VRRSSLVRAVLALVLALVAGIVALREAQTGPVAPDPVAGVEAVERAFAQRQSGQWVEVTGTVSRELPDDQQGSQHQRFVVELSAGLTVLVAHNIDLAPRFPLERGDTVTVRGEYEWNDRGGVIHWTHHDPQGRRTGGFVRHDNELYQ